MLPMAHSHTREPERTLARWQVALVATTLIVTAVILVALAAASSYDGLWHLAAAHNVPLPRLNPLGLDGGLIGVIVLAIGLTWLGYNFAWLRLGGRVFALGTIAANAAAGWPDPIAVGLRAAAPVLLVLITEAVYAVLLGRNAEVRDRIPLMRWVLSPWATFRLWRRMVLWRVNSYAEAVEMELGRLRAIKSLAAHYKGKDWREQAPADLVWMLTTGVKMAEALESVAGLTERKPEPATGTGTTVPRKRKPARQPSAARPKAGTPSPAVPEDLPLDTEARILALIERGHSASEAGVMAGKSDSYGRQVARLHKPARKEPAGDERSDGDVS